MRISALLLSLLFTMQSLGQESEAEQQLSLCIQKVFDNELIAVPYIVAFEGVHIDDRANVHSNRDDVEPRQVTFAGITAKSAEGTIRTETKVEFGGKYNSTRVDSVLSVGEKVYVLSDLEYKELNLKSTEYSKLEKFYELDPFQAWLAGAEAIRFGEMSPRRNFINFLATKPITSEISAKEIVGVWLVNSRTSTFRIIRFDRRTRLPIRCEFGIVTQKWNNEKSSFPFGSFSRITSNKVEWIEKGDVFLPERVVSERYTKSNAGRGGKLVLSSAIKIEFKWGRTFGLERVFTIESLKRAQDVDFEGFTGFFR
jgi:hypothetical protein